MPEPPPPKRFQIHLSTAIVLMFVAGGLIWANTTPRAMELIGPVHYVDRADFPKHWLMTEGGSLLGGFNEPYFGWPFSALDHVEEEMSAKDGSPRRGHGWYWRILPVIGNAIVGSGILLITWRVCEYLIRRRAARKEA